MDPTPLGSSPATDPREPPLLVSFLYLALRKLIELPFCDFAPPITRSRRPPPPGAQAEHGPADRASLAAAAHSTPPALVGLRHSQTLLV